MTTEAKKQVGFAAMTPERRREIALAGQAALKAKGTRRVWTTEEARAAAMKAVEARRVKQQPAVAVAAGL